MLTDLKQPLMQTDCTKNPGEATYISHSKFWGGGGGGGGGVVEASQFMYK